MVYCKWIEIYEQKRVFPCKSLYPILYSYIFVKNLFLTCFCCLILTPLSFAVDIATTRQVLSEWVATEQLISEEREEWATQRELIQDRLALMHAELTELDEQLLAAEELTTQAGQVRGQLLAQEQAIDESLQKLTPQLVLMQHELARLRLLLPKALKDESEALFARLATQALDDNPNDMLSLQLILELLEKINEFNQNITLVTDLQQLPDGKIIEVEILYVGLGAAYFIDAKGNFPGRLVPSAKGWQPELLVNSGASIRRAINNYKQLKKPSFVDLPVRINTD